MTIQPALFRSASGEWLTPQPILDLAVRFFVQIDLDPAADPGHRIPATHHFTKAENGLTLPWGGRVWLNPPYGRVIDQWIQKLVCEYEANIEANDPLWALVLLPARTDTGWWQRLREYAVCFIRGRLCFEPGNQPAPFPSAIVYLGPDVERFNNVFRAVGDTWLRYGR